MKGATGLRPGLGVAVQISIHAPVKGATGIARPGGRVAVISIHAPVKGATGRNVLDGVIQAHFNPRSREGSDLPHPP